MDIKIIQQLNEIFEPLHRKSAKLKSILKEHGFDCYSAGWYNMHSVKYKDEFIDTYFPIPVLSIKSVGDIGINLEYIFLETTISKEKAEMLQLDYLANYNIEVYGVHDYLQDYYVLNMEEDTYKEQIRKSSEKEFHFTINLSGEISLEEIPDIIFELKEWKII